MNSPTLTIADPVVGAAPPVPAGAASRDQRHPRSDFSPLAAKVKQSGLLAPRYGWYVRYGVLILVALAAMICGLVLLSGSWWAILLAPVAALISAQIGFYGHDAGHHQITQNRKVGAVIQYAAANVLTGLSIGWWNDKHNRHHANPNHEGLDPDVGESVIAWTEKQYAKKGGAARWLAKHQAGLFFPLLTFE